MTGPIRPRPSAVWLALDGQVSSLPVAGSKTKLVFKLPIAWHWMNMPPRCCWPALNELEFKRLIAWHWMNRGGILKEEKTLEMRV